MDRFSYLVFIYSIQKQPSRGALWKKSSENMQQIHRRTPMSKYDFNKVAMHGCSPVNLMYIFRKLFLKNTSGRLLLSIIFSLLSYQKKLNSHFAIYYFWYFLILSWTPYKEFHISCSDLLWSCWTSVKFLEVANI